MVLWWICSTLDLKSCTVALAVKVQCHAWSLLFQSLSPIRPWYAVCSQWPQVQVSVYHTHQFSTPHVSVLMRKYCLSNPPKPLQVPSFCCCFLCSIVKKQTNIKLFLCLFTWHCLNLTGPKPSYDFWLVSEWPSRLSVRFSFCVHKVLGLHERFYSG